MYEPNRVKQIRHKQSHASLGSIESSNSKQSKNIHEVHFTSSVLGVAATVDNSRHFRDYLYKGKKAALMGRSSANRGSFVTKAFDSNAKVDCAYHSETISSLKKKVDEMRDEVKIKDRLVSSLLAGEGGDTNDILNTYKAEKPASYSPDSATARR